MLQKARVIVLTDIGPWTGEPDDAQSLVRLMLYSNEYDIEGIIPNASWCGPDTSDAGYMQRILDVVNAYAEVRENLAVHANGYPTAEYLASVVKRGTSYVNMKRRVLHMGPNPSEEEKAFAYGEYKRDETLPRNVGKGCSNDGSRWIIRALRKDDPRPLHIELWGGCGTLAQAFSDLLEENEAEAHRLAAKAQVYDIHGQDDCGAWLCSRFPELRWFRSTTTFWGFSETPHRWGYNIGSIETVWGDWLETHIRRGPFGRVYPHTRCGLETDSPSMLIAYRNGLSDWQHPEYGGWGGRFSRIRFENVPAEFFTKTYLYEEQPYRMFKDETDDYSYRETGKVYKDTWATLERWKEDYQNDMAARIDWSVAKDYSASCHNPIAILNNDTTKEALFFDVRPGDTVSLSLDGSFDPDGGALTYCCYSYKEAGTYPSEIPVTDGDTAHPVITVPMDAAGEELHFIIEVQNHGRIPLKSYRRVILRTGDTALQTEPEFINDTEFSYHGNWNSYRAQYGCYREDQHLTREAGASAEIVFEGRRIMLFGNAFRTNGIAHISIDGTDMGECDFYSQFRPSRNKYVTDHATSVMTMQYLSPCLTPGKHTLTVTATGKAHPWNGEGSDIILDCAAVFK